MDNDYSFVLIIPVAIVFGLAGALMPMWINGYKQGQIDAINGKFKYKQVNAVGYEEVGE